MLYKWFTTLSILILAIWPDVMCRVGAQNIEFTGRNLPYGDIEDNTRFYQKQLYLLQQLIPSRGFKDTTFPLGMNYDRSDMKDQRNKYHTNLYYILKKQHSNGRINTNWNSNTNMNFNKNVVIVDEDKDNSIKDATEDKYEIEVPQPKISPPREGLSKIIDFERIKKKYTFNNGLHNLFTPLRKDNGVQMPFKYFAALGPELNRRKVVSRRTDLPINQNAYINNLCGTSESLKKALCSNSKAFRAHDNIQRAAYPLDYVEVNGSYNENLYTLHPLLPFPRFEVDEVNDSLSNPSEFEKLETVDPPLERLQTFRNSYSGWQRRYQ